ncbi:MAG: hypothetical protein ABSF52_06950 [Syntrophobacteraceae bacterium]|jgi:hypothetical protein
MDEILGIDMGAEQGPTRVEVSPMEFDVSLRIHEGRNLQSEGTSGDRPGNGWRSMASTGA